MSDDDFMVIKPVIKRYKRRKQRSMPQPLNPGLMEEGVGSNLLEVQLSHQNIISSPAVNQFPPIKPVLDHVRPKKEVSSYNRNLTDLEAFLSDKSSLLGKSECDGSSCLPDLEVETVPREDDHYFNESSRPVKKDPIEKRIVDIKMATKSLCDSVQSKDLKQVTLLGMIKGGEGVNQKDTYQPAGDQSTPKAKATILPKAPVSRARVPTAAPLQPKMLIKQAGTSQLDLGAMFGLKPKEMSPVKVKPERGTKKTAPFYKWIRGTYFTVDAFNFGEIPKCTAYFLSHFHSDHYMGLNKQFTGTIYCSSITANYVTNNLKVNSDQVRALKFDETEVIQGVKVSLIEANHCPGSAMFLFESPAIGTILHTGDFRYDSSMLEHPVLRKKSFDIIYLDTTYFDPTYVFPPQQQVIQQMVKEVQQFTRDTLIVCGSYTIGKERLVEGLAKALDCKVCVTPAKMNLIKLQENEELSSRLTKCLNSRIHLVPMKDITPGCLAKLLSRTSYTSVVGIKPTGWTHGQAGNSTGELAASGSGCVRVYSLPYSEHSSYRELEEFIRAVSVKKIVSTVLPRSEEKRKFMFDRIKEWTKE